MRYPWALSSFVFFLFFLYCLLFDLATMNKMSILLVQVFLLQKYFHFRDRGYHGWSRIVMLKNRHMFKAFSKEIVISHSYCVRGPVVQQLCWWSVLSTVLATSMSILIVCGWDCHLHSSRKNGPSTYYQRGQSKVPLGLTLLYQEKAMLALFPAPNVTSRCLGSVLNLALPLTACGGHMLYDLAAIPSPFL